MNLPAKYRLYVGIDPGSNTGVAIWDAANYSCQIWQFESHCEALFHVRFFLEDLSDVTKPDILFRIEDARRARKRPDLAEVNKGREQGVGYVKAYCKDWEAFCKLNGYPCELLPPTNTKVTPEYFKALTGIATQKGESHKRDAGMLVWGR